MNLIVLAAGSGKRLYPLTKDRPKSLLDIGDGTTLLDRQLAKAVESDCIDKVYIVVGYLYEMIEQAIVPFQSDIKIETIYNPYFDVSNALLSLWCANSLMLDSDFFISNGDNLYKTNIFEQLYESTESGLVLATSKKNHYDDDDMKIICSDNGSINKVSKDIAVENAQAESVGLLLVKGEEQRNQFRNALLKAARDKNYFNAFWQQAFDFVVNDGGNIGSVEVNASDWAEVDFHPDVELMRKTLFGNLT